jgi:hypothetical protein
MKPLEVSLPLRLGFLLERTDVSFPYRPGIFYRGVDRLPFDPSPEEEEELNRSGRVRLVSLWHRYGDALFTGDLHRDQQAAVALRGEFEAEGLEFEAIYAAVVSVPQRSACIAVEEGSRGAWERLQRHQEGVPPCPDRALFLGYDVSYPLPSFHSVLLQPGLREQPDAPLLDINSAGLLTDVAQLEAVLEIANALDSPWRPFCGIAVYSVR